MFGHFLGPVGEVFVEVAEASDIARAECFIGSGTGGISSHSALGLLAAEDSSAGGI
jgi:hypothetical protein